LPKLRQLNIDIHLSNPTRLLSSLSIPFGTTVNSLQLREDIAREVAKSVVKNYNNQNPFHRLQGSNLAIRFYQNPRLNKWVLSSREMSCVADDLFSYDTRIAHYRERYEEPNSPWNTFW
jgi:hypothetical protein